MTLESYFASVTPLEVHMMLRGFIPTVMIVIIGIIVGRLDGCKHQQTLEKLIHYIFLPCLTFSAIHKHPFDPGEVLRIGIAVTVMAGIMVGISLLLPKDLPGNSRSSLIAAVFMSSGTLLLPLSYILFGNEGLAKALYFHLFVYLLFHSLGSWFVNGTTNLKAFFRTPFVYMLVLGVAAVLSPLSLPENVEEFAWLLEKGIDLTGMGGLPLLLISFGYPLGLLKLSDAKHGISGGLLRIVAGPLLAFLIVYIYRKTGFLGMERGYDALNYLDRRTTEAILLLGAAMPTSHYALRLDCCDGLKAGQAEKGVFLVSAAGSIITITLVLFLTLAFIFIE